MTTTRTAEQTKATAADFGRSFARMYNVSEDGLQVAYEAQESALRGGYSAPLAKVAADEAFATQQRRQEFAHKSGAWCPCNGPCLLNI